VTFPQNPLGGKVPHVEQLRKRHPTFPISTGRDYQYAQPNTTAHIGESISLKTELHRLIPVCRCDRAWHPTDCSITVPKSSHRNFQVTSHVCNVSPASSKALRLLLSSILTEWTRAWKLIKEAVSDWPLALCDATTVDVDLDVVPADMLYEKVVTENSIVHYNPK